MENKKESSDGEDIPSDFFDDFNKDDFIEGLSVIDSWKDEDRKHTSSRARINAEAIDSVRDLRELILRETNEERRDYDKYGSKTKSKRSRRYSPNQKQSVDRTRDGTMCRLNEYIKPGSRRDPNKTNQAIKKDKEEKVKEYLAKHLESTTDLRPPGTELDDFLEEARSVEVKKNRLAATIASELSPPKIKQESPLTKEHRKSPVKRRESPERHRVSPLKRRESPLKRRESPTRHRESPGRRRHSPGKRRESPLRRRDSPIRRRMQWSPRRQHYSPRRSPYRSFKRLTPERGSRHYHRFSPRRPSPETRRERRSRSPYKRLSRRSRSRSVHRSEREVHRRSLSRSSNHIAGKDDFLYPKDYFPPPSDYTVKPDIPYPVAPAPPLSYAEPVPVEYAAPTYTYAPGPAYSGYGAPYEYGVQPASMAMSVPQPVPAPVLATTPNPISVQAPAMVPAPQQIISPVLNPITPILPEPSQEPPVDALAKLVADGKLSHEDYLKLTPNKGVSQSMDTHARVAVLNRCHNALSLLGAIGLPNRLLINNSIIGSEPKQIIPKFCSPLKRQVASEFYFTKCNPSAVAQQNKQIIDCVVSTLGIQSVIKKPKKKPQKDTKEIAVQTMKPFCEMCEIRELTKSSAVETMTDREHFTSTVYTQVVEQDLYSSKAVFNPTGAAEGANMSIAHMTPAQLVSQLAARAKTLKQSEAAPGQYRHNDARYDYDGRGDQYRYNNYRY